MSLEQPKFEERPEIKTDKTEQQGEKIMEVPEIVVQPEKGAHLMSVALKGYNSEWGNHDHELAKLTEQHFSEHPLDVEVKNKVEELKNDGVDEESMYNLSLTYQHPERVNFVFNMLEKHKDTPRVKAEESQRKITEVLSHFDGNPLFDKLESRFAEETQKDVEMKKEQLEESRQRIKGLIDFFRPKSETTPVETVNIMPADFLYKKASGKSFGFGKELVLQSSGEDSTAGQAHEFLHSVINPITDKLDKNLTGAQKEKIVQLASGKLKEHYGQNVENYYSLLNEGFIRTYLNIFEKGENPLDYKSFRELISQKVPDEKRFQEALTGNEELKKRFDALGISGPEELLKKSRNYFNRYEKDGLGNIIFRLYKDYGKEHSKVPELTFEDFVLKNFSRFIPE